MNNKVYYGEYTLRHWIKLMLTGDIILPEYQRHFVWEERDVKRLIQSFKEGQFVQPVTIALYDDGQQKYNYILDGQQRLTSVLLAFLGYFPNKKMFKNNDIWKNEDDSAADDESSTHSEGILWRFSELTVMGKNKESIKDKLSSDDKYKKLEDKLFSELTDDFFNMSYLGFSYVVSGSNIASEVQKNFSQLFRNINYFGKKLGAMDSRKSLYYQNPNLTKYFEGKCKDNSEVFAGLTIKDDLQPCKIDFVRYLSILSQYHCSTRKDANDIMVGYSAYSSRENYYSDYVSYIIGIEQEDRNDKFDDFKFDIVFPNDIWKSRFETLRDAIVQIKPLFRLKDNSFGAGYEADYWIFGLMYHILFEGKNLKSNMHWSMQHGKSNPLMEAISNSIEKDRRNPSFSKNSNRLTYIRKRLISSCSIYSDYVQE